MNPAPPLPASVEHFADLVARLAAPFAVRETVLRDAGLDERAWSQLEAQWMAHLAADGALVDRYIARYAALPQTASPAPAEAMRLDGTLRPEDIAVFRAVLPFVSGSPAAHVTTKGAVNPPANPGRPDATLDLGASLPLPRPPLASAITAPSKRLHRFDSKTGAPLPVPVWADDPADPKKAT
jgi:hypothetical protein